LNSHNEGAEMTLEGRLFHGRAAVTRNEPSPIAFAAWSVVGSSWSSLWWEGFVGQVSFSVIWMNESGEWW